MTNEVFELDTKAQEAVKELLGGGDGGIVEVPANSNITLDGDKLLQLLIAKDVDVDAEIEDYYDYYYYAGLLLGCTIDTMRYLDNVVNSHAIFPYKEYNGSGFTYGIKWLVQQDSSTYIIKEIEEIEHITFKTMLQALGTVNIEIYEGISLVPYIALKTSSQEDATPVSISTDQFLSFITITPLNAE